MSSNLTDFFPGSGGGGSAIGDYGVKYMAKGADVFTDANDDSVWFKTGYVSTDLVAYPDFISSYGAAAQYNQLLNTSAFGANGGYVGNIEYNSEENKLFVSQLSSYTIGNFAYGPYELDPANIPSGNWGALKVNPATTGRYSFEPVGDGIGNNYVLKSNGTNTSTTTGAKSQQRTTNWLQQSILQIGKVSGGTRSTGYTFDQTINISGIPTGSATSSYKQYQTPISIVATENYFYYSFLQRNPGSSTYLTYYYGNSIFFNVNNRLTDIGGRMPQPSNPNDVYARIRCVKLSKTGAFISELTRPYSDVSGGGGALLVFTDPLSTGDSFYTLDKNSVQNGTGPVNLTEYAGFQKNSNYLDFSNQYIIRKHSEDGTVIKTSEGLPISSITQTNAATGIYQQAFCTPDGVPHYFTAAAFSGSAAQTTQKASSSPLVDTFNIIKLGNIVGDSTPRFTSMPTSTSSTQTGMGVNTSNVQIMSGPSQTSFNPTQLYIRVK
jgi:hypothetical protein